MRLSLVISSLSVGGAERVLTTLANAWTARGHQVDLMTTHDGGCAPHYQLTERVRLQSVDPRVSGAFKQASIIRSLRRAITAADPDAIVSFLNYTNILTLLACRGLACPVVISERADPRLMNIGPAWSLLRRVTYRRAACLIAQTPTAAKLYEHLAPGRVRVIPNPVSMGSGESASPRTPPTSDRPTILAVGRLHHQKGFDLALRAMALLPPSCAGWRLVILGEGTLRSELESLRDELGLGDRVLLPGQVADPRPWLEQAQIFLMSSRSEGFPNALCEAMAAGLPVISTDCPSGPANIITTETDGILIPTEDPRAMSAALARLITSEELRVRLARAAPGVADRFSLDSVLAAWEVVLDLVTANKLPPHRRGRDRGSN